MAEKLRLSTQVRAGFKVLSELKAAVLALPEHQFSGTTGDEDDATVFDYLAATDLVLARMDEIPKAALALILADMALNREEQLNPEVYNLIANELTEIEDDKATGCGRRRAEVLASVLPLEHDLKALSHNVIAFPGPRGQH